jgi:hypothetical protein
LWSALAGHADAPSPGETKSWAAIQHAYGVDHDLSDAELLALAASWRTFPVQGFGQ